MSTPGWFQDRWPTPLRAAYGVSVAAVATLFTLVFYAATAGAVYAAMLAVAVLWNGSLGSPFFVVAFVFAMSVIGLVMALFVYGPLTLLLARLARRRLLVWFFGPLLVAVPSFVLGFVLAANVDEPDLLVRAWARVAVGLVLPWFVTGGFLAYWLVVVTLTQLLPRLVHRVAEA